MAGTKFFVCLRREQDFSYMAVIPAKRAYLPVMETAFSQLGCDSSETFFFPHDWDKTCYLPVIEARLYSPVVGGNMTVVLFPVI